MKRLLLSILLVFFLSSCDSSKGHSSSQSEPDAPISGNGVGVSGAAPRSDSGDRASSNEYSNRRKHTYLHPYISSINVNLDSVKFFEGPYYPPNKDQRVYRTGFDRRTARYINWEINFTHKAPGTTVNFQISANWYRNTKLFFRDSGQGSIQPNWEYSYFSQSYSMNPWVPGIYRVDIYINGSKVTSETFDVYNADCSGDLTFPGADRVEQYRQNAEANNYSGDALYQYVVALHNRGGQCFLNGNLDAAYEDFTQAIQYHPKFDLAYYHRGLVLMDAKRPKDALTDLNQAINFYQADDYYDARGKAYFALDNDQEALADLDQAIQLNGKRADLYHDRGIIRYYLGDDQNALADLKQAVQIYQNQNSQEKANKVLNQIEIIEGRAQGDVKMNDNNRQFTLAEMDTTN